MKAKGEIAKIQADIVVLRYPISATAAEKPLPRKGPESFPSWTSPVRPRSPALRKSTGCVPSCLTRAATGGCLVAVALARDAAERGAGDGIEQERPS